MDATKPVANYFFVGFTGCGKTSVGARLAQLIHHPFTDLDEKLMEISGKPVMVLYLELGEEAYRQMEARVLEDILKQSGQVIAVGAGTVVSPINLGLMRQNGILIYLDLSVQALFERIRLSDKRLFFQTPADTEPITDEVLYQRIRYLHSLRHPIYLTADIVVAADEKDPEQIAQEVFSALNQVRVR